ncbi:Peptidase family S41 [Clostridium amylolyticum]|uniref:Peptidase family S41 n=1 Tax=Clostridium amylolyticum TaxID=1121298 RepID=A0A1M6NG82_9CLOT|nr:S41 family peptidase [Clostridium amylolyticum]SHJ94652.1 Peptidase family S41 [Clostridium amylolyticum]
MKRSIKIFLWIGASLLLISLVFCGYLYFFKPISMHKPLVYSSKGNVVLEKELTKEEVKEDVKSMINIIEETHPIFLEGENKKYQAAKENFIKVCNNAMTTSQFQLEASKYLCSLEDGHTGIRWNEVEALDINWLYLNGKLSLMDKDNKIIDKEVVKINGINIEALIKGVKEIFPAENYVAENKNIANRLKGKLALEALGVEVNDKVPLTIKGNNGYEDITVKYAPINNTGNYSREISSKKIDSKTFYIRLGICEVNNSLNSVIEDLKSAMNEGGTNVIIDVRDNPGGNSQACTKLLDAMNMKPGHFGAVIRFSPLAQKYRGYLRSHGKVILSNSNSSKKNENIDLYVITNENTFSSAQWLATWVQDGKLGDIAGSASSNMPSSYGDVVYFQLSNSKIEGSVSHKKFTRPDSSKDKERALEPDIKVEIGQDPLQKVKEIIKEK